MFKNKILLITGGTGSFGRAVLSRFLKTDVSEIRIFSRDEKKQEDMRISMNSSKLKFHIGDVRDYKSISSAMIGVDFVFHAAALKQVPSCEFYPMEAVKTNILGAENVLESALQNHVKNLIVLSTDKAVYPINAMGISKAMMEKLMISKSRLLSNNQVFSATRYGNVMASRGSVIPLFISQILSGDDLTVTDPNMTRFIMSLEESVKLVEFAFLKGRSGDIFVQKAPAATTLNIAKALLRIFKSDNDIKIIGTRHGEKLYETLLTREEMQRSEDLGSYFRIPSDNRDLNYAQFFTEGEIETSKFDDFHSHNTEQLDIDSVEEILRNLPFVKDSLNKADKK